MDIDGIYIYIYYLYTYISVSFQLHQPHEPPTISASLQTQRRGIFFQKFWDDGLFQIGPQWGHAGSHLAQVWCTGRYGQTVRKQEETLHNFGFGGY